MSPHLYRRHPPRGVGVADELPGRDELVRDRRGRRHLPARRPAVGHDRHRLRARLGGAADRAGLARHRLGERAWDSRIEALRRQPPGQRSARCRDVWVGARRGEVPRGIRREAGLPSATPAIDGALAHLDCEVDRHVEVADHTIVFGRVRARARLAGGAPLLYFRRATALADAALDSRRRRHAFELSASDAPRRAPGRARRGTGSRDRRQCRSPRPRRDLPLRELRTGERERLPRAPIPGSSAGSASRPSTTSSSHRAGWPVETQRSPSA